MGDSNDGMTEYRIARVTDEVPLNGTVADSPWEAADVATIDVYPWPKGRNKQTATVRALYDDDALSLQYHVADEHSSAETTELNGPVWTDSAVECFARPDPDALDYFNFEANCVGTFLLGWGDGREGRVRIEPGLAASIAVETSIEAETKDPAPDDESWWLAARLPFETLSAFAGTEITPEPGSVWRGNFQRLGGDSESAVWNPIRAETPDFHLPRTFGRFVFE